MARQKSLLENLTPTQRIAIALGILLIVVLIMVFRSRTEPTPPGGPPEQPQQTPSGEPMPPLANRNIRFGMPAEAKADAAHRDAFLIDRPQFVLSYNDSKRTANWVSWNLNKHDIGPKNRVSGFHPDPDLPPSFRRVKDAEYKKIGFDRGHICPSKDRSDTEENNTVTFFTTNIVPQAPKCNKQCWLRFEDHCRDLTGNGSEVYIAAGPYGEGGEGDKGEANTVSDPPITVPSALWKVVMVLPNKEAMPAPTTRTLAVWMPNNQNVSNDWKPYAVSIAEVEKRTGYTFFPVVPADIANKIKTRVDRGP